MRQYTLLKVTGDEARSFLQGLVTNDLSRLEEGPVYAALLTPQGKYLFDFILSVEDGAVLIDVAADQAQSLAARLNMYKLRAKVDIAPDPREVHRGTGDAPAHGFADPRHPALGWRAYGGAAVDITPDWDALRVAHCIPETGIELTPDTFILEAGFARLNGVDFRKGCFVGQEIVARMHHKTELRKGLVVVDLDGPAPPPGTKIFAGEKEAGTVFTASGARAIAYLRLDRAKGPMQAGQTGVTWNGQTWF